MTVNDDSDEKLITFLEKILRSKEFNIDNKQINRCLLLEI